jgi:hypothetical protein
LQTQECQWHKKEFVSALSSKLGSKNLKIVDMQPRRVTHNIGDSKFIYGRPNERNALGVREGAVSNQIQYIPENLPLKSPHCAPLLSNSIFCKSLNIYTPEKPQCKNNTHFITYSEISQWPAISNKFSIQLHFLHLLQFENSLYNQSVVTVWNFRNRRWKLCCFKVR